MSGGWGGGGGGGGGGGMHALVMTMHIKNWSLKNSTTASCSAAGFTLNFCMLLAGRVWIVIHSYLWKNKPVRHMEI